MRIQVELMKSGEKYISQLQMINVVTKSHPVFVYKMLVFIPLWDICSSTIPNHKFQTSLATFQWRLAKCLWQQGSKRLASPIFQDMRWVVRENLTSSQKQWSRLENMFVQDTSVFVYNQTKLSQLHGFQIYPLIFYRCKMILFIYKIPFQNNGPDHYGTIFEISRTSFFNMYIIL